MSVFRVNKDKNYTVMSNYHLRDKQMSLKAKGLLSIMLSLPEDWDYTIRGLVCICKEGETAVKSTLNELKNLGYLYIEKQLPNETESGRLEYIYNIYENPKQAYKKQEVENHPLVFQPLESQPIENPVQSNKDNQKKNNKIFNNKSNQSYQADNKTKPTPKRATEQEADRIRYEKIIKENIDYDYLIMDNSKDDIDEIVSILIDAVTSQNEYIRISGQDRAKESVKSQLLKLNYEHINYVLMCLNENTTKVRNIKSYLLTSLYNAPMTMSNYYTTRERHDMANMG